MKIVYFYISLNTSQKKLRTSLGANNLTFDYIYNILIYIGLQENLLATVWYHTLCKRPDITEFDVDLHKKMSLKSHIFNSTRSALSIRPWTMASSNASNVGNLKQR